MSFSRLVHFGSDDRMSERDEDSLLRQTDSEFPLETSDDEFAFGADGGSKQLDDVADLPRRRLQREAA